MYEHKWGNPCSQLSDSEEVGVIIGPRHSRSGPIVNKPQLYYTPICGKLPPVLCSKWFLGCKLYSFVMEDVIQLVSIFIESDIFVSIR